MANNTIIPITIQISPKQMARQWANVPHKFQVNIWDLEVKLGKAAQEVFKKSFELQRFNSSDSTAWAPRKNMKDYARPILIETASLKNSIKWKHIQGEGRGVTIYTDPNVFGATLRHQGFCYAAVHNGPQEYRTKHMKNMPRRQFIGHSDVLKDKFKELSQIVVQGLP